MRSGGYVRNENALRLRRRVRALGRRRAGAERRPRSSASFGNGFVARNASQRPSCSSSCAPSTSAASVLVLRDRRVVEQLDRDRLAVRGHRRSSRAPPSDRSSDRTARTSARRAAAARRSATARRIDGAGVSNVNFTPSLSTPPVALFVPAGTSTLYVVACGNRTSGSNSIVRVPIQRQRPFGVGVSFTGIVRGGIVLRRHRDHRLAERHAQLGRERHRRPRASSAARADPCRSSFVVAGGSSVDAGGGNVPLITLPVRGGGCDFGRSANALLVGRPPP